METLYIRLIRVNKKPYAIFKAGGLKYYFELDEREIDQVLTGRLSMIIARNFPRLNANVEIDDFPWQKVTKADWKRYCQNSSRLSERG